MSRFALCVSFLLLLRLNSQSCNQVLSQRRWRKAPYVQARYEARHTSGRPGLFVSLVRKRQAESFSRPP